MNGKILVARFAGWRVVPKKSGTCKLALFFPFGFLWTVFKENYRGVAYDLCRPQQTVVWASNQF